MLAEAAEPDQRAAKKMRPGHCTKKIHPWSPEVSFLGTDTSFAQSYPPLLKKYLIEGNRPFYRYGGHIELIRSKEYYRMPIGHEHISFVFSSAFQDIFS